MARSSHSIRTPGQPEWQTQVARWQDGYTITSAPTYYNGVVYTGISGGDMGVRGKLTALDARTGQELAERDGQTGLLYVGGTNSPITFLQPTAVFQVGKSYGFNGATSPLVGVPRGGSLTAIDPHTNTIIWQNQRPYTLGSGSGTMTTAGLLFHGDPDGNFNAYDARSGDTLWSWQTGAGADAPAVTYPLDGVQHVTIAAGGTSLVTNSQRGDMICFHGTTSPRGLLV